MTITGPPTSEFASIARPGRDYPEHAGIVEAIGPLTGRNRIAAAFYDGPGWARFRTWERLFLRVQGGEARARRQILRHLIAPPNARVLEVGIGDGANLRLLAKDWIVFGADIARTQLNACLRDNPDASGRLVLAEAEVLPFADASFDACWTLGGFNYFGDHAAALREMARVTRPGGVMVVADENPNLHRLGIGNLLGFPSFDALWLRAMGLDREFTAMVQHHKFDPDATILQEWPGATRHAIWGGLGYCFVHRNGNPPGRDMA